MTITAHRNSGLGQYSLDDDGILEGAASEAIQLLTLQLLDIREVIKKDTESRVSRSHKREPLPIPTFECVSLKLLLHRIR